MGVVRSEGTGAGPRGPSASIVRKRRRHNRWTAAVASLFSLIHVNSVSFRVISYLFALITYAAQASCTRCPTLKCRTRPNTAYHFLCIICLLLNTIKSSSNNAPNLTLRIFTSLRITMILTGEVHFQNRNNEALTAAGAGSADGNSFLPDNC